MEYQEARKLRKIQNNEAKILGELMINKGVIQYSNEDCDPMVVDDDYYPIVSFTQRIMRSFKFRKLISYYEVRDGMEIWRITDEGIQQYMYYITARLGTTGIQKNNKIRKLKEIITQLKEDLE